MARTNLILVESDSPKFSPGSILFTEKLKDHSDIINGYKDTYKTRNFSENTFDHDFNFIENWFKGIFIPDSSHPDGERQLLIWEAMEPVCGRQRIIEYSNGLCTLGLTSVTRRNYLGILRRLFEYVLEWPYIPVSLQSIRSKYGALEQPVLKYDYPVHSVEQEMVGCALTGDALLNFYYFIKSEFIPRQQKSLVASRDYVISVLAGESGLRPIEICNLDAYGPNCDLYFEEGFIQTRFGKGTRGSGKRIRKTRFTDIAQATIRPYLERIRPHFLNAETDPALFLGETGNRISYSAMARNFKRIVEAAIEAGLDISPDMSLYDLRRSFATNIVEENPGRIWEAMALLGHSNPSTINRYLRLKKNHLLETRARVVQRLLPVK